MSEDQPKPVTVQILVDGRTHHSFVAQRLVTNETRELLTLKAVRWPPSAEGRPAYLMGTGTLIDIVGDESAAAELLDAINAPDLDLAVDAAEDADPSFRKDTPQ